MLTFIIGLLFVLTCYLSYCTYYFVIRENLGFKPEKIVEKFIDGILISIWLLLGCGLFIIGLLLWIMFKGCSYLGTHLLKILTTIKTHL